MQITYDNVKGYATYANAQKRGAEVASRLEQYCGKGNEWWVRWLVVALPNGRFAPAFNVSQVPGGPGPLLSEVNVCTFN